MTSCKAADKSGNDLMPAGRLRLTSAQVFVEFPELEGWQLSRRVRVPPSFRRACKLRWKENFPEGTRAALHTCKSAWHPQHDGLLPYCENSTRGMLRRRGDSFGSYGTGRRWSRMRIGQSASGKSRPRWRGSTGSNRCYNRVPVLPTQFKHGRCCMDWL